MDRFAAEHLPEVIGRRTASSRHYLRPDGRFQAIIGAHLNYRSGGEWKRREDFTLREVDGEIVNDSEDVPIRLRGLRVQTPGGFFELEGLYLDDDLLDAPRDVTPIVTADTVTYPDVFPGVDVEYLVTPHRVKETVRIRRNPLLGRFVSGSELSVRFKTSGRQKFRGVYAHDAQRPVDVAERWKGARYELAIATADLRRVVYPLDVDPTVSPIPSSDAYFNAAGGVTDDHELKCGHYYYDDGKGTIDERDIRSYLRFDFSSIATTVTAATINLWRTAEADPGFDTVRQVTAEVDPETGDGLTAYNNAAGTSLGALSTGIGAYKSLDITAYANAQKGGFCDFGLVGHEITGADTQSTFASSEHSTVGMRPYASVTYSAGGGGTTYTKALSAVSAAVPSALRSTRAKRATVSAAIATARRSTMAKRSATSSAIASAQRSVRRSFSASAAASASVSRAVARSVAVVASAVPALAKTTRHSVSAFAVVVPSVAKTTLRSVSASASAIVDATGLLGARVFQIALSASSSALAGVSRVVRVIRGASSSAAPGVSKRTSKTLGTVSGIVASVAKATRRTVTATASAIAAAAGMRIGRLYEIALGASSSAIASASRSTRHAAAATSSAIAGVTKRTRKALDAAASAAVSAAGTRAGRIYELAVSAVSSASVSVSRTTRRTLTAGSSAVASVSRLTRRALVGASTAVVSVNRTVRRSMAAVASAIVSAHPARMYRIALAATSSALAGVSKTTRRSLSASAGAVASVSRLIRHSVGVAAAVLVSAGGRLIGHVTALYRLGVRAASSKVARLGRRDTEPRLEARGSREERLDVEATGGGRMEIKADDAPARLDVEGE